MTSTLSPETVAQMVADREAGTPGPWMIGHAYRSIVSDANTGYDRPDDVDAYGGHLVCESVKWDANARRISRLPDLEAAYLTLAAENATLRASEAAAMEALAEIGAVVTAIEGADSLDKEIIRNIRTRIAALTPTADKEPKT